MSLDVDRLLTPAGAVRCGDEVIPADTLAARIAAQAGAFAGAGVARGDRVGLLTGNCHTTLVGLVAAWRLGAIAVPLDEGLPASRLAELLAHAQCRAALVPRPGSSPAGRVVPGSWLADRAPLPVPTLPAVTLPAGGGPPAPVVDLDLAAPAILAYTSGSSGAVKGVLLSFDNFVANAEAQLAVAELDAAVPYLHLAPICHLADLAAAVTALLLGCSQRFVGRFSVHAAASALQDPAGSWTVVVPTMLSRLVAGADLFTGRPTARRVVYGGSHVQPEVQRAAFDLFGDVLVQTYGQTETTSVVCALTRADHVAAFADAGGQGRLASAGRPAPGVSVTAVDGEVQVAGRTVALGYWRDPERTARSFAAGRYRTGDLGEFDPAGYLTVLGRRDDMVQVGGNNVSLVFVERVLNELPGVLEAAVVAVPDRDSGTRLTAWLHAEVGAAEIRDALTGRLAAYEVPAVLHVTGSALPKASSGKIDRAALRELAAPARSRGSAR